MTDSHDNNHNLHPVPLWGLFILLLALTAGEVGLFEYWHSTAAAGSPIFPKYVMVILLMVMTLPKAAIVMIYFMHLKFEKPLIVFLAIVPLLLVFVCVLVPLVDGQTLKGNDQLHNKVEGLSEYKVEFERGGGH
jgi:hypothetical protein